MNGIWKTIISFLIRNSVISKEWLGFLKSLNLYHSSRRCWGESNQAIKTKQNFPPLDWIIWQQTLNHNMFFFFFLQQTIKNNYNIHKHHNLTRKFIQCEQQNHGASPKPIHYIYNNTTHFFFFSLQMGTQSSKSNKNTIITQLQKVENLTLKLIRLYIKL